jgi:Endonuclease-reverse transcriptase
VYSDGRTSALISDSIEHVRSVDLEARMRTNNTEIIAIQCHELLLLAAYIHPSASAGEVQHFLSHIPRCRFVLFGDLNLPATATGNHPSRANGHHLDNWIEDRSLHVLNDGLPTFRATSALDVTITSEAFLHHPTLWKRLDCDTDHCPILSILPALTRLPENRLTPRVFRWDLWKAHLRRVAPELLATARNLTINQLFESVLQSIAYQDFFTEKNYTNAFEPSNVVRNLEFRRLRRLASEAIRRRNWRWLRQIRKDLKALLQSLRQKFREDLASNLPANFWPSLKQLCGSHRPPPLESPLTIYRTSEVRRRNCLTLFQGYPTTLPSPNLTTPHALSMIM